nr:MAG TPA: hypothetical protein [Caudoviricetes sp.]
MISTLNIELFANTSFIANRMAANIIHTKNR